MVTRRGGGGRKRIKQARKRKAKKDAEWQRQTNFGFFVRLWVPHHQLVEALVGIGYLDEADRDIAPRVDAAADKVFEDYDHRWWDSIGVGAFGVGSAGTVRVRPASLQTLSTQNGSPPTAFAGRTAVVLPGSLLGGESRRRA